ncbi:HAMP domain-containing sensor histidine kinase, partial [Flavihumibacter sp. CACIAM 22H1]|uniref:sensor histidine kinase n=1 Tax=Flavihumibacter sp. CACIAM 22H1 TaxID=1812911 RepID=UPI0025BB5344
INALLEIAKAESGSSLKTSMVRLDELIFDIADELKIIEPDFLFSIEYEAAYDEPELLVYANYRLLRAAVLNLMQNCIQYSSTKKAAIRLKSEARLLQVVFENEGAGLTEEEQQLLFQHFFRGTNSAAIRGFGLGLVFVHRMLTLHGGTITYKKLPPDLNQFTISLPLS